MKQSTKLNKKMPTALLGHFIYIYKAVEAFRFGKKTKVKFYKIVKFELFE